MTSKSQVLGQLCKLESPISLAMFHARFVSPFSQWKAEEWRMKKWKKEEWKKLAVLTPQCSWQKVKLNQPQLLCLLNTREEGDYLLPMFCRRSGWEASLLQDPFWWCHFPARTPQFISGTQVPAQLEVGTVCPAEWGCKWGLRHSGTASQLSGFAPDVCQMLSIHWNMMKNISVSLWLSSS